MPPLQLYKLPFDSNKLLGLRLVYRTANDSINRLIKGDGSINGDVALTFDSKKVMLVSRTFAFLVSDFPGVWLSNAVDSLSVSERLSFCWRCNSTGHYRWSRVATCIIIYVQLC